MNFRLMLTKWPKMALRWLLDVTDGPGCRKMSPRWPQDSSKMAQDGTKVGPKWPKTTPQSHPGGASGKGPKKGSLTHSSPPMGASKTTPNATTHPPHFVRIKELQLEPSDRLLASFRDNKTKIEALASFKKKVIRPPPPSGKK